MVRMPSSCNVIKAMQTEAVERYRSLAGNGVIALGRGKQIQAALAIIAGDSRANTGKSREDSVDEVSVKFRYTSRPSI